MGAGVGGFIEGSRVEALALVPRPSRAVAPMAWLRMVRPSTQPPTVWPLVVLLKVSGTILLPMGPVAFSTGWTCLVVGLGLGLLSPLLKLVLIRSS